MKLTKNFWKHEFDSKDGSSMPSDILENVKILAEQLQKLRDKVKKPIKVNSGYRSPAHNKSVKGSSRSQHLLGKASDISVLGHSPKKIYSILEDMINKGEILQGGLGLYNSFVHYDIRGTKARWDFSKK